MIRSAHRIEQLPPYLFAELERKVAERRRAGVDVISLGIGDPDLPTPRPAGRRGAPAGGATRRRTGIRPTAAWTSFREAVAGFYRRRFGVELDPDREVLPLLGGKEGVAHVCFAMLDPGDVVPGRPTPATRSTRRERCSRVASPT